MRKWLLLSLAALPVFAQCEEQETARNRMVAVQIEGQGVKDAKVLAAMRNVPRHEFVPKTLTDKAYDDRPLPIGHGQTISQPFIVALMTQALDLKPSDRVLEIGTGSGYQAAILSKLVQEVYTIEIVAPLGEQARNVLKRLGYTNIKVRIGDGYRGWPEAAPFDGIIVTCAPDAIPKPLTDQLAEGGRMVIPVGPERHTQQLIVLRKQNGALLQQKILPVIFVPMTGEAQSE